jgi:acetyl-CoA carboxylase biotin carboxyl carrier protein
MREITATMAGTVLNIFVAKGDQVSGGQDVIMLESMKMEIPIQCEVNSVVKEVKVNIGDFVNEDEILIVLE